MHVDCLCTLVLGLSMASIECREPDVVIRGDANIRSLKVHAFAVLHIFVYRALPISGAWLRSLRYEVASLPLCYLLFSFHISIANLYQSFVFCPYA